MKRTNVFFVLLFLCSLTEAKHANVQSSAEVPSQEVEIEQISIKLGDGILCKAVIKHFEQRCYLEFSFKNSPGKQFHRLICDSPCPRDVCEVDDNLINRQGSREKEQSSSTESNEKMRNYELDSYERRGKSQQDSYEHIDEGNTNFDILSGGGKNKFKVRQLVDEIYDLREPNHNRRYPHRSEVLQKEFGSAENEDSSFTEDFLEELIDETLEPEMESNIDGFEPLPSNIDGFEPLPSNIDGNEPLPGISSMVLPQQDTSAYLFGVHMDGRTTRRKVRGRSRRSSRNRSLRNHGGSDNQSRWSLLYDKLGGPKIPV